MMKTNFDGMRKKATVDMNNLFTILDRVIVHFDIDDWENGLLKERYNAAAQSVDMMNCLHDNSVEDDMNDLSHLSINRFEEDAQ